MDIPVWIIAAGSFVVAAVGLVTGIIGTHIARRIEDTKLSGRVANLEVQLAAMNLEIAGLRKAKHDHAGHRFILESHDSRITRAENKLDKL